MRRKRQIPVLYYAIGQKIRTVRLARGLSQEELAGKAGIARTTLVHIEEAKNRILIETLYRLANVMEVEIRSLLPKNTERIMKTREDAFLEFLEKEPEDQT